MEHNEGCTSYVSDRLWKKYTSNIPYETEKVGPQKCECQTQSAGGDAEEKKDSNAGCPRCASCNGYKSVYQRYLYFIHKGFVQARKDLITCGNCHKRTTRILEYAEPPEITCVCGDSICPKCELKPHYPAPCAVAKEWVTKTDPNEINYALIYAETECQTCKDRTPRGTGSGWSGRCEACGGKCHIDVVPCPNQSCKMNLSWASNCNHLICGQHCHGGRVVGAGNNGCGEECCWLCGDFWPTVKNRPRAKNDPGRHTKCGGISCNADPIYLKGSDTGGDNFVRVYRSYAIP